MNTYFCCFLQFFPSPLFYTKYVKSPRPTDPLPEVFWKNCCFFPYFANALGAIDGTHIVCSPSAEEHEMAQNQKGFLSQNCLMTCSFDLKFTYVVSGWDGCTSDATMLQCWTKLLQCFAPSQR
jgi:hypothetical protein